MDDAFVKRIEDSFDLLAPRGAELVDRFYANFFARNPAIRAMFPGNMGAPKKKLLASLVLVVKSLRKGDELRSALIELGGRHVKYGSEPVHYPLFRDTLLDVMGQMSGELWTEQLASDWEAALNVVAGIMIDGQRTVVASPS